MDVFFTHLTQCLLIKIEKESTIKIEKESTIKLVNGIDPTGIWEGCSEFIFLGWGGKQHLAHGGLTSDDNGAIFLAHDDFVAKCAELYPRESFYQRVRPLWEEIQRIADESNKVVTLHTTGKEIK